MLSVLSVRKTKDNRSVLSLLSVRNVTALPI